MNALVIVPTYNERDNIPPLVGRLLGHAGLDVLIVDDERLRRCRSIASCPMAIR